MTGNGKAEMLAKLLEEHIAVFDKAGQRRSIRLEEGRR